jgi:hypothetical protein
VGATVRTYNWSRNATAAELSAAAGRTSITAVLPRSRPTTSGSAWSGTRATVTRSPWQLVWPPARRLRLSARVVPARSS